MEWTREFAPCDVYGSCGSGFAALNYTGLTFTESDCLSLCANDATDILEEEWRALNSLLAHELASPMQRHVENGDDSIVLRDLYAPPAMPRRSVRLAALSQSKVDAAGFFSRQMEKREPRPGHF